ncbi:hypothetical protein [Amycolatopsis sp. CA-230715]|uniref:hypothetical protein n=1 Tax=Amycolatopsis sp. CA-230715 TaxID=2745196 RepID=UPI001C00FB86|nr:hypothetical protein [Amycolatopsis sp. CA-230715]QWF81128.1 hypothetical protein HUW46_04554 [Amycolatopsis sp. CA-230715]
MPNTPIFALPYPAQTDPPNGPGQIQALATATETALGTVKASPNNRPYFHGYTTGTQGGFASATDTPVNITAEFAKVNMTHPGGSSRVTPTVAGIYRVKAQIMFPGGVGSTADDKRILATIRVNGSIPTGSKYGSAAAKTTGFVSQLAEYETTVRCNGTSDYIEMWANHNMGGTLTLDPGSILTIERVGDY